MNVGKIIAIRNKIRNALDGENEQALADAILDYLEVKASETPTRFDDIVLRIVRRVLGVPDND